MTYYNIVFRAGQRRFARSLADAGVAGAIIPDLPLEESEEWCAEADAAGVETVLLVAPSTPRRARRRICERARGFVYGVGVMGVTGERAALAATAGDVASWSARHRQPGVHRHRGVDTRAGRRGLCRGRRGRGRIGARAPAARRGTAPREWAEFVASLRAGIDDRHASEATQRPRSHPPTRDARARVTRCPSVCVPEDQRHGRRSAR